MRRAAFLAVAFLAWAAAAPAATILIVNSDGAGEGFNDPTPVAPVGGNPGVTIGQQRLNVFQHAAGIWGGILPSAVTIRVEARFNPQSCSASSAVLGSAGPIEVFQDFPNAPLAGTWYHVALANRLAGVDLSPGTNDIVATFNSSIDNNNNCLANTNWYYGLDGNEGTDVELLPVVLHELGHGLGFSTLVNGSTGAELLNDPDVYETFIRDNTQGTTWPNLTNAGRQASAVNTGNVVWNGPAVLAAAPDFLGGTPTLFVNSGGSLPATIPIGLAQFGAAVTEGGVTGNVVLVDDGAGTVTDACSPLVNGGAVSGNIALIDRGTCTFVSKALAAQNAGAIAVIIANNVADPTPPTLGGSDPSVVIPVISVTQASGNAIKAELGSGVNVTIALDPAQLAGADGAGRVKLYAPNPLESGSSTSHWDVSANPNLLMEPAINGNLSDDVDLTLAHFTDIGWIQSCLLEACPADTTVPKGTAVDLEFCVTNCGQTDSVTVTVTDTQGWCPPVDVTVAVAAGDDTCVTVTCSVPDDCGGGFTDVVFSAAGQAGAAVECTTRVTRADCAGPLLALEPSSIIFPVVALGDTLCDSVCVINLGDDVLTVSSVTGCGTGGFFVDQTGFDPTVAPGDTTKFLVCFTPQVDGADSCTVSVVTDGGNGAVAVSVSGTTGLGDPAAGRALVLSPVVPTPFAASAQVRFSLPGADRVSVTVYDLQGRMLRGLADGAALPAGEHALDWDGRDDRGRTVAEGIYFIRVVTGEHGTRITRAIRLNR